MKKLTDKELQEELKWTQANVAELDDITSGRVTRGAFARIAGLKMKLEAAHHALIKDTPQVAAPVVIMLVGMDEQVRQIDAGVRQDDVVEAELAEAPSGAVPALVEADGCGECGTCVDCVDGRDLEDETDVSERCDNAGTERESCPCLRCVTARTS